MNGDRPLARRIGIAFGAVALLGVASALSNIMTEAQLMGQAPRTLAARFIVSMVLNSPVVWAGTAVLAGFLVRKRRVAVLAAPAALLLALAVHYGTGQLIGIMPPTIWSENVEWFRAAVVTGIPLGLVGATASRPSPMGLIAALVVPIGAVAEPLVFGSFGGLTHPHWPTGVGQLGAGVVLTLAGVLGLVIVSRRWQRARSVTRADRPSERTPAPSGV